MKKRWLSLIMLFCFCICFIGGCRNPDTSDVNKLNIDGKDVVLKVGDKTYTADELFGDMLNSEVGVVTAYEKILKMVVESSVEENVNMTTSWELMLENFENEVTAYASSNSVSESAAREALLAEDGYASIEEMREEYIYQLKLAQLQNTYWSETKDKYYDEYFEDRLPYYVKHVLVKTSYTAARGAYSSVITESQANALYKVYDMLKEGYKFSYIMNQVSEDTGSSSTGLGYHMDLTTSFVSNFLHGVFTFDSLLKSKTSEVTGLTSDILNYYASSVTGEGYGFNVINASDLEVFGSTTSVTSYYNYIYTYENETDGEGNAVEKTTNTSTISSDYGSYTSLYTRNILFNQIFNNPGISVISYDIDDENTPSNVTTLKIDGVDKKVLTDENGNIVFVVCAKGSSSDLWVHFLTVPVSPFDDNAKLFYSMDQEETINKMIEAKRASLVEEEKTEEQIDSAITDYKLELDEYSTYVDLKGGERQTDRNTVIEEIEEIVETYAKRGITSGVVAGQDQFLTYDMVEYYLEKGKINITNETIKNLIVEYIANQKALIDFTALNSIVSGWEEYYDELSLASSDLIIGKKIPMECSYSVNADLSTNSSTESNHICKYNYSTGFEIKINYTLNSGTMPEGVNYVTSYHIGDDAFTLPTPTREGYTFEGWYSTSDFKEGTKVTSIDTKRSSTSNKTKLYANWVEEQTTGGN